MVQELSEESVSSGPPSPLSAPWTPPGTPSILGRIWWLSQDPHLRERGCSWGITAGAEHRSTYVCCYRVRLWLLPPPQYVLGSPFPGAPLVGIAKGLRFHWSEQAIGARNVQWGGAERRTPLAARCRTARMRAPLAVRRSAAHGLASASLSPCSALQLQASHRHMGRVRGRGFLAGLGGDRLPVAHTKKGLDLFGACRRGAEARHCWWAAGGATEQRACSHGSRLCAGQALGW